MFTTKALVLCVGALATLANAVPAGQRVTHHLKGSVPSVEHVMVPTVPSHFSPDATAADAAAEALVVDPEEEDPAGVEAAEALVVDPEEEDPAGVEEPTMLLQEKTRGPSCGNNCCKYLSIKLHDRCYKPCNRCKTSNWKCWWRGCMKNH